LSTFFFRLCAPIKLLHTHASGNPIVTIPTGHGWSDKYPLGKLPRQNYNPSEILPPIRLRQHQARLFSIERRIQPVTPLYLQRSARSSTPTTVLATPDREAMSLIVAPRAPSTITTPSNPFANLNRPLSCISGLGGGCGRDNWDHSPGSGFYTVCCDGNIIDFTGFNSWTNYTLLLKNLICCPHEKNDDAGPVEVLHCNSVAPVPLSELLATSTEVAQPWTRGVETIQPECFWSQFGLDALQTSTEVGSQKLTSLVVDATTTTMTKTVISTTDIVTHSTAVSSSESPVPLSTATVSASVATSQTLAATTAASPTGQAAANLSPSRIVVWGLCVSLALGFVL